MSPSLARTKTRWETGENDSEPNRAAIIRPASAMPTAFATPCPRGPVVASTPLVRPNSGWPGVRLPHWRKAWISDIGRS